jgi:hypothetical protein
MRDNFPKPKGGEAEAEAEDVCAGHALGFPHRADLGFLPIENLTLDVFRCLCDVYATGSAQPWEIANKIAEDSLGAAEGALLVARVTALLRAVRAERKLGFSYLSIGCQHISPDELAVAGVLKAARARDESAMERGLTLALDNFQTSARTQFAARALAALQSQHMPPGTQEHAEGHDLQTQSVQAFYLH